MPLNRASQAEGGAEDRGQGDRDREEVLRGRRDRGTGPGRVAVRSRL